MIETLPPYLRSRICDALCRRFSLIGADMRQVRA